VNDQTSAVFLSYSSQDAAVARRISRALRDAGIEVWLDESELRGGDEWDATIKRQIKTCALFIAIVSEHSQARIEGYFRLEWKLAVDRSHLMAADRPFLLPVVIDTTAEASARVPDRFRDVQWTRLASGEPTAAFVAHVQRLLAATHAIATHDPGPGSRRAGPDEVSVAEASEVRTAAPVRARRPLLRFALGAAAIAILATAGWYGVRSALHPTQVAPYSLQDRRMTFAVLPFDAPPGDAAAADVARAVGDAVTTAFEGDNLWTQVTPRQVVARSVAAHPAIKEIGRDLDVHFLIRGTTSRAPTGFSVDLFAIDAESERVIRKRTLSVPAGSRLPTWSYDVGHVERSLAYGAMKREVERVQDRPAAALDVRDLGFRAFERWNSVGVTNPQRAFEESSALLKRALELAPDDKVAIYLTAFVNLCDCVYGWSKDVEANIATGSAAMERFLQFDPTSADMLSEKADLLILRGRYEEALLIADGVLKHDPQSVFALPERTSALLKLGRPAEALATISDFAEHLAEQEPYLIGMVGDIQYALGHYDLAAQQTKRAVAHMASDELSNPLTGPVQLTLAAAEARLGHADRAKAALADFWARVPNAKTIAAMRAWMRPNADLTDFEPLFDGLRIAGVAN